MSKESEDNIIKNISKEITRDCSRQDVSPELAEYVVRLKLLNPENGFTARYVMKRSLIQKLVSSCVEDLKNDTPAMKLIRLQSYWVSKSSFWSDRKKLYDNMPVDHVKWMNLKCQGILEEICSNQIITKEDRDDLTRNMVMYMIIRSGMGNISNILGLKETRAALGSVFKEHDLKFFASLTKEGKKSELELLNYLVAGIRLYQKLKNRGGESIENVIESQLAVTKYLIDKIRPKLSQIRDRIDHITVGLEKAYNLELLRSTAHDTELEITVPEGYSRPDMDNLQDILSMLRQHEKYGAYLFNLILTIHEQTYHTDWSRIDFHIRNRIDAVVASRLLVPTSEIHHHFVHLGDLWEKQQANFILLAVLAEVEEKVDDVDQYLQPTPLEVVLCPHTDLSDKKRIKEELNYKIYEQNINNPDVKLDQTTNEIIQFSGFCAWTIAQAEGMLVKGVEEIGVLSYSGRRYCFSTANAAYKWAMDPQSFIIRALNNVRYKTWLVELLGIYNDLREVQEKVLVQKVKKVPMKFNTKAQTVLHPIPKFLDKDYTFSEWVLKRRAIQLANMVKCVTKSVQTVSHSHYRGSIALQCAPDKTQTTQTRRDAGAVHPTISNYIYGLRGLRGHHTQVHTLTRPIDEDFGCPEKKFFVEQLTNPRLRDRPYSFGEAVTVTQLKPITSSIRMTRVNP